MPFPVGYLEIPFGGLRVQVSFVNFLSFIYWSDLYILDASLLQVAFSLRLPVHVEVVFLWMVCCIPQISLFPTALLLCSNVFVINCLHVYGSALGLSRLYRGFIDLSLCPYLTVLITVTVTRADPCFSFFFISDWLDDFGPFTFPYNFNNQFINLYLIVVWLIFRNILVSLMENDMSIISQSVYIFSLHLFQFSLICLSNILEFSVWIEILHIVAKLL